MLGVTPQLSQSKRMPYVQERMAEEEKETRQSGEEQNIYIANISRGHPLYTTKAVVPNHIRRVRTGSYDNPITVCYLELDLQLNGISRSQ